MSQKPISQKFKLLKHKLLIDFMVVLLFSQLHSRKIFKLTNYLEALLDLMA